ncbi:hypothetical protein KCU92_g9628, partial [Aureobasidium melanogenum]
MFTALVRVTEYWEGVRIADTVNTVTADLQHTLDHYRTNGALPERRYFPCGGMSPYHTAVTFACNPLGNHWLAVKITKGGEITVYNSCTKSASTALSNAILDRALPLYGTLLSLRPGCTWNSIDFLDAQVTYVDVAQQENSFDCGPATLTTLVHTIKNEQVEAGIYGLALRFAHLNILMESFMGDGCVKIEGQTVYTAAYTTWKHSGQMTDPLVTLEYGKFMGSFAEKSSSANHVLGQNIVDHAFPQPPYGRKGVVRVDIASWICNVLHAKDVCSLGIQFFVWNFLNAREEGSTSLSDVVSFLGQDPSLQDEILQPRPSHTIEGDLEECANYRITPSRTMVALHGIRSLDAALLHDLVETVLIASTPT